MSFPEVPQGESTAAALASNKTPPPPARGITFRTPWSRPSRRCSCRSGSWRRFRSRGGLDSQFVAIGLALLLSLTAVTVGADVWKRRPGGRDLLFGDLMIWGWIRQLRARKAPRRGGGAARDRRVRGTQPGGRAYPRAPGGGPGAARRRS